MLVDGWLCVTAVTVDDAHQRQGLATAVMAALGRVGARARAGTRACCRWPSSNGGALALYERLGFTEHHRYHYRLGADAGAPSVRGLTGGPARAGERPADRERGGE